MADVLGYLALRMTEDEILSDFPHLEREDIKAALKFAADREHRVCWLVSVKLLFDESISYGCWARTTSPL